MRIAIIGTAGRKEDGDKLNKELYEKMVKDANWHCQRVRIIADEDYSSNINTTTTHLVSGGAAWADHVAVSLYLMDLVNSLTLYFPCGWEPSWFIGIDGTSSKVAQTANYYHDLFSIKMEAARGKTSRADIQKAIDKGAIYHEVAGGFKSRNLLVGKVDAIIAYTFGEGDVPKDGGTKHTWDYSTAPIKIHRSIQRL